MSFKSFTTGSGVSPVTKIRAEQIKAEVVTGGSLADDLLGVKEQIAAIAGAAFDVDYAADYANVQMADLAAQIDAGTAGLFKVKVAAQVTGTLSASLGVSGATLTADGLASVGSAKVANLNAADGALVFADADGDLDNDSKLKWDSSGKLLVDGTISGSADLQIGTTATIGGAATFAAGMTVNGAAADFNAGITANQIKIDGDTSTRLYIVDTDGSMKDESGLTYASSKLSVTGVVSGSGALQGASVAVDGNVTAGGNVSAVAGTFSGAVTVGGDLVVNGTTTYVNTENTMMEDALLLLGSGSVAAGDRGIVMRQTATSGYVMGWDESASEFVLVAVDDTPDVLTGFSNLIGPDSYSKLHIGDLTAAAASVASVAASGGVSAAHLTASNLDNQQIAFAQSDNGEIIGSSNLKWTGAQLQVVGVITGSGQITGASFLAAGTGDVGALVVQGQSQFKGQVKLEAAAQVSGSIVPTANVAFNLGSGANRYTNAFVNTVNAAGATALDMVAGSDQKIVKSSGAGDLILSSSVAAGFVSFDDAYRGAQLLNGSFNKGIKLANSGEWATFASNFPAKDSLLGALNALSSAAAGSAAKNVATAGSGIAAATDLVTALPIVIPAGYSAANSMAFVNGQLLKSGSQANVTGATADYSFDGGAFKLSFALEAGDVVTIQKI